MSKSTRGIRAAGVASLAVTLSIGVAAPAFADADFTFDRIGGDDRYQTAALVADEYGVKPDAIIANGQPGFYADALAGNYLSGAEDAPILLTRLKGLPDSTLAQLDEQNAENVWIVGGESVVPAEQEAQLESEGYNVVRVAGDDRFETNAEVLAEGGNSTGGVGLIATGFNFPDALAAGPFAYNGHSLGLSTKDDVKDVVLDALVADGVEEVLIFGGLDAVGAGVEADLASRGIEVLERFDGADRSETSTMAAEWALANIDFTDTHVGVASGYTEGYGADALAGGPLEGMQDAPMLVTRNVTNPGSVVGYLEENCQALETGHLFGGPAAIAVSAEDTMEEAAQCAAGDSATTRPELLSAQVIDTNTVGELGADGTTVRFTFDEDIQNAVAGDAPDATQFYVYDRNGLVDAGDLVTAASGNTVTVRFDAVVTDAAAAALTVGTVDEGAVEDLQGQQNPEGDAPLGTTGGGGTTPLPAGVTEAPDLNSVGGFDAAAGGATDVEFVFDEAADVLDPTLFTLIDNNGDEVTGDSVVAENSTTVIIRFSETLTRANIARATVDAGAVQEQTDNEGSGDTQDANVLQAADVNNSGNTGDPDLVSVALQEGPATGEDRVLYTFDEAIASANDTDGTPGAPVVLGFQVYYPDATEAGGATGATINGSNPRQVLVSFPEGTIDEAVGGSVLDGTVTGTDGNDNEQDEVGVANTTTTTGRTAGRTDGPDLTAVALSNDTDLFGNVVGTLATYTFDEAVATEVDNLYFLYLANGTKLTADSCTVDNNGTVADTTDDTDVVCEFDDDGTGNNSRALAATLGTVDNGAGTDADADTNPEGAEFTTGGTGTPAS